MRFGSCLLWRTLLFVSVAEFLTVFSGMGVFAIPSDCKSATIDDMNKCLEVYHKGETKQQPLNTVGKKYSKCFPEMVEKGGRDSLNRVIWLLQESLDLLRPSQDKFCKHSPQCPQPLAPKNGGLACVTIDSVEYCKPMCNKGYDFQFLRRSRLYETCGNITGFSWTTQMAGGQALAVCEPSETAVSGVESAYFPANSSCLHTLAFSEAEQLNIFLKELAEQGVDISNHDKQADCLMCGY